MTDIEGLGDGYAEKLQAAGVKTSEDLLEKGSSPQGRRELAEINDAKKLVRSVPSAKMVTDWIEQAKALPRKIKY